MDMDRNSVSNLEGHKNISQCTVKGKKTGLSKYTKKGKKHTESSM